MIVSTVSRPPARIERFSYIWLFTAAAACAIAGVSAMLAFAPHVPYADQWRHYAHLLTLPFPANVFEFDNGHAEVLPNLLRWLDLSCCGGHETLQILCAAGLALSAAAVLLRASHDPGIPRAQRAAQTLVVVLGVFWLGNLRALTQAGDGVHVYLVLTCLAAALCLTVDVRERALCKAAAASLLCLVATFSFGSGIATFAAVLVALLMQRAPKGVWLIPAAVWLLASCVYAMLADMHGGGTIAMLPVAVTTLRVLGTPFVYMALPLLDPAAAAAVPAPLNEISIGIANAWTARFGAIRTAALPQAALGMIGVIWLLTIAVRSWRIGRAPRAVYAGIALACFGVAAAALIALARQDYFAMHAEQIGAPRYVPWSSLFWTGLLLAQLGRQPSRAARAIVIGLPLVLLPSEIGLAVLARHVREVAEDTAVYAAVGVLPEGTALGETTLEDVRGALPVLRAAHTAIYAWPETEQLERGAQMQARTAPEFPIDSAPTANLLDGDARKIPDAQLALCCAGERALVLEHERVVGLLRRRSDGRWHGAVRGTGSAVANPSLAAICAR